LLIANQSAKAAFELFGTGTGSAKERAAFANSNQGSFKLLQNASEVVDYFLYLCGESGRNFAHGIVEFLDNPTILIFLLPRYFLILRQLFLDPLEQVLRGLVLQRRRQPVRLLA